MSTLISGRKKPYWEVRELVVIGIFAAVTKVSSLLVALLGGGLNPITLILKNIVATALLIVLLFKVRKFGTMTLFIFVSALVSTLLMGRDFVLLPATIMSGLISEGLIVIMGGYKKTLNIIVGVALFDILFKSASVAISWLFVREQPAMIYITAAIVGIGYIGAVIGLFVGSGFVKELRHACIIRD